MRVVSDFITFEWDRGNRDKNLKKHVVTNEEAEQVFTQGRKFIIRDKKHSIFEDRFILWGATSDNRKLNIIFTIRKDKIRIISARNMNRKERRTYAEKIKKDPAF